MEANPKQTDVSARVLGNSRRTLAAPRRTFFFAEEAACVSCAPFLFGKASASPPDTLHMPKVCMPLFRGGWRRVGTCVLLDHNRIPP